ncbi:MAG: dihydropteroate synthase [Chitinophagales bacterium]|nr:dihydropteroate synthase [Chitinophagales bacterium]MDW8418987.1 dihydropteroate synthase [Chitinophagales bacterium]
MIFQCRGRTIDLSQPKVMGIINLTPDSFYDGGRHLDDYLSLAERMLCEGAVILDVGGMSTRPGAKIITAEEEVARIEEPLRRLIERFPEAIFSVDTLHAATARLALQTGAHIINDITAGTYDKDMFSTVASFGAAMCLMHIQGTPETMQHNPLYKDVVEEVYSFLEERIVLAKKTGVTSVIADVGFGFGKTLEHNYLLLQSLHRFKKLQVPLLCGVSRKSMVTKLLHTTPDKALNGTTALHTICLLQGADILRVHDVQEAVECIKITEAYRSRK